MFGNVTHIEAVTQPLYCVGVLPPYEFSDNVNHNYTQINFYQYAVGENVPFLNRTAYYSDTNLVCNGFLPRPLNYLVKGFEIRLLNDRSRKLIKKYKKQFELAHFDFIVGNKIYYSFPFLQLLHKPEMIEHNVVIQATMNFRVSIDFKTTFEEPITVFSMLRGSMLGPVQ